MRPQDVIRKKRDGEQLSREEITFFIEGVTRGTIADYQISALLMAIYLNGMNDAEQEILTDAMLHSGNTLDFSDIAKPKADKHSTGGVGDKTSLLIAPMVAACGICVPMISGRGLGHTGGTLDKLESIPGYRVDLSATEFEQVLQDRRLCNVGTDRGTGACRQKDVRAARCYRHRGSDSADRGFDNFEKGRRRSGCNGHRREGGLGRVHAR